MTYKKLYDDFKTLFPAQILILQRLEQEAQVDESDGMHIYFGFVVVPFLLHLFDEHNNEAVKTAFGFFEKMAISGDTEIGEVLEFTVLENIISSGKAYLSKCKQYMGSETLLCCAEIEKYSVLHGKLGGNKKGLQKEHK